MRFRRFLSQLLVKLLRLNRLSLVQLGHLVRLLNSPQVCVFLVGNYLRKKRPIFVYLHRLLLLGVQPVVLPPVQSEVPLPVLHTGGSYVSPVQPDISDAVPWAAGGSGAFGQFFRPAVRFSLPAAVRPGQPGSSGRDPRRRHQPAQTQGNIKKLDFYLLVFEL